jgi:hypothetical protein
MQKILVTGMSGTGKSNRARRARPARLSGRRHRFADLERVRAGRMGLARGPDRGTPRRRPRAAALRLRLHVQPGEVYDRLDAVVLLSAPAEVILDRVGRRTRNDYGKAPAERAIATAGA